MGRRRPDRVDEGDSGLSNLSASKVDTVGAQTEASLLEQAHRAPARWGQDEARTNTTTVLTNNESEGQRKSRERKIIHNNNKH